MAGDTMVPPTVEVAQGAPLVPDQTDTTVSQKGEVPLEAEAVSAVVVEVEVAHTVLMSRTIKAPRKAIWEATTATSQGPRKNPSMAMVVSMQGWASTVSSNSRTLAILTRDLAIMKVRLNPYRKLNSSRNSRSLAHVMRVLNPHTSRLECQSRCDLGPLAVHLKCVDQATYHLSHRVDISPSEAYFASCVALRLCCSVFWGSKVNSLSYSGFCQTALVPTMVAALADQGVAEVRDGSESGIGKTKFTIPLLKSAYNENALVAHCSSAILRRVLLIWRRWEFVHLGKLDDEVVSVS